MTDRDRLAPRRIQRKRTKGWRMPPNTVYVGRPTKFGNPFPVALCGSLEQALERYRFWLKRGDVTFGFPPQPQEIRQLRGKDLACWCPLGQPCHADVLLEMANGY
jgi:hypothetical protein